MPMGYSGRSFGLPCRSKSEGDGRGELVPASSPRQQFLYFFPLPQGRWAFREVPLRSIVPLPYAAGSLPGSALETAGAGSYIWRKCRAPPVGSAP